MSRLMTLVRRLRGAGPPGEPAPTDHQCLEQFLTKRDQDAFAVLVRRHGPMVMAVCRRVLGHAADAEDAFQAVFLVLVRKAGSLTSRELLANWLYGVAYRTALKARAMNARRRAKVQPVSNVPEPEVAPADPSDSAQPIVDEELSRLPDKYRLPIILCELEGKTHEEAAAQLGWPVGTLSGRLSRARKILAERLTRRGVMLGSTGLTGLLAPTAGSALPPAAVNAVAELAGKVLVHGTAGGGVSANVLALTEGVVMSLFLRKLGRMAVVFLMLGVVGTAAAVGLREPADPKTPFAEKIPDPVPKPPVPVDPLPEGAVAQLGTTRFRHVGEVTFAQFTPDGKHLITAGTDDTIRVWEFPSGKELRRFDLLAPGPDDGDHKLKVPTSSLNNYWSLALSADGTTLAYNVVPGIAQDGRRAGVIRVWDIKTGKEFRRLPGGHLEGNSYTYTYSLALTPDGKSLAVWRNTSLADNPKPGIGPWNIDIDLWNLADGADGKPVRTIAARKQWPVGVARIAFSPDGKILAELTDTHKQVYDPKEEKVVADESLLCLWDPVTGKNIGVFRQPGRSNPTSRSPPLLFSPDSKRVAARSSGSVHLHDVESGKLVREPFPAPDPNRNLLRDSSYISAFAFTADGKQLLTQPSTLAEVVQVWDLTTEKAMRTIDLSTEEWRDPNARGQSIIAVTPDSKFAAVLGADGCQIRFLDLKAFKELPSVSGHTSSPTTIRFVGDGTSIMTFGEDRRAYVWDTTSGARKAKLHLPHPDLWQANQLSPDGSTVVTIGRNPEDFRGIETVRHDEIVLWNTADGEVLANIKTKPLERWGYNSFSFSRDGKVFALRTPDCVDMYDVATREKRASLNLPPAPQREKAPKGEQRPRPPFIGRDVLLTPDGGVVVVDCGDGTLRVWEPATKSEWEVKLPLPRNNDPQARNSYSAHLFSDGKTLALTGIDDEVILLDLSNGKTRSVDLPKIDIPPAAKGFPGGERKGGKQQPFPRPERILAYSADGKAMAALGSDRSLTLVDLVTRETTNRVDLSKADLPRPAVRLAPVGGGMFHGYPTHRIVYSPDGKTLAVLVAPFSTVLLLDANTGKELGRIKGHEAAITGFAFSPDSKRLVTGSADSTALVWDISKMRPE